MYSWERLSVNLLCLMVLLTPVHTAADGAECTMPRYISCFNCDSRYDSFCEDPFNETDIQSLQHMKKCDSECLKWEREVNPKDPNSDWYIMRVCKSDVAVDMYLSPDMCISESRPGSGHMCTCNHERCNSANEITSSIFVFYSLSVILLND